MITLPHMRPVRGISEAPPPEWYSLFGRRELAMAMLSVKKWRLSGNFEVLRLIDPPPEEAPYLEVVGGAVQIDLGMTAPAAASERVVAVHALTPSTVRWDVTAEETGDLVLTVSVAGHLMQAAHASGGGRPFGDFHVDAWAIAADRGVSGASITADPAGTGTLEISLFGQTWTTPATMTAGEGGEDEPDAAPPANVKFAALEYWTYGGRFDPATGAPV